MSPEEIGGGRQERLGTKKDLGDARLVIERRVMQRCQIDVPLADVHAGTPGDQVLDKVLARRLIRA